jgi:hypothetical protein
MPDLFDPGDFDSPPPKGPLAAAADPGADYRTLLDAMRKAGAEGIAQQAAVLVQRIDQDARQRAEWGQQTGASLKELQHAADSLNRAGWEGLWRLIFQFLALIGGLAAFVMLYHWWETPKVESHYYGCEAVKRHKNGSTTYGKCQEIRVDPTS